VRSEFFDESLRRWAEGGVVLAVERLRYVYE
jgi:hypothetical protein